MLKRASFLAFTILAAACAEPTTPPLEEDRAALTELDQAYAAEWIAGNADGVMDLFTEDATLVPHHGDDPIVGRDAIRNFWFNPQYPPTVVPEWTRTAHEIEVFGDVAFVRGRATLTWEYQGTRTTIPDGNYVLLAARKGGDWRIRLLTWNDDPQDWVQSEVVTQDDPNDNDL